MQPLCFYPRASQPVWFLCTAPGCELGRSSDQFVSEALVSERDSLADVLWMLGWRGSLSEAKTMHRHRLSDGPRAGAGPLPGELAFSSHFRTSIICLLSVALCLFCLCGGYQDHEHKRDQKESMLAYASRNSLPLKSQTGTWRQELKQRPQRKAIYWLPPRLTFTFTDFLMQPMTTS